MQYDLSRRLPILHAHLSGLFGCIEIAENRMRRPAYDDPHMCIATLNHHAPSVYLTRLRLIASSQSVQKWLYINIQYGMGATYIPGIPQV